MGGWGSGRSVQSKGTTSDFRMLDVRRLRRLGVMTGRQEDWNWSHDGKITASVKLLATKEQIMLDYRYKRDGEWKPMRYAVRLAWSVCHLGGQRPWFLCPIKGCGHRAAILYFGRSGIFACRHCFDLAYDSQRESPVDRGVRRADKLRARLNWEPGILNSPGPKPRWMHWKTFAKLKTEHDIAALAAMTGLAERVGMVNARVEEALGAL